MNLNYEKCGLSYEDIENFAAEFSKAYKNKMAEVVAIGFNYDSANPNLETIKINYVSDMIDAAVFGFEKACELVAESKEFSIKEKTENFLTKKEMFGENYIVKQNAEFDAKKELAEYEDTIEKAVELYLHLKKHNIPIEDVSYTFENIQEVVNTLWECLC